MRNANQPAVSPLKDSITTGLSHVTLMTTNFIFLSFSADTSPVQRPAAMATIAVVHAKRQ